MDLDEQNPAPAPRKPIPTLAIAIATLAVSMIITIALLLRSMPPLPLGHEKPAPPDPRIAHFRALAERFEKVHRERQAMEEMEKEKLERYFLHSADEALAEAAYTLAANAANAVDSGPEHIVDEISAHEQDVIMLIMLEPQYALPTPPQQSDDDVNLTLDADAWALAAAKSAVRKPFTGCPKIPSERYVYRHAMAKKNGGTPETERAVNAALHWLAYYQEPDGHWDAKKHGAGEKTDTAVTALALLAFLAEGHTEKRGAYKPFVQRAVAWLIAKQAANGLIWDTTDAGGNRGEGYPAAIATQALSEAAGMERVPATMAAAQKAVDYCTEVHQCGGEGSEKGGWRYHPKQQGDTSVTGWFIMALKAAKDAGLRVNPESFDGAIKFLDSVEHKEGGDATGPSKYWYTAKDAHDGSSHRLTAIGVRSRQILGWSKDELRASIEGFVKIGGFPTAGKEDLYYWYYGTSCVLMNGGDLWRDWNKNMIAALLPMQNKAGPDKGSWSPTGDYSTEWGRVGQTALSTLCLQVYYRADQGRSPRNYHCFYR